VFIVIFCGEWRARAISSLNLFIGRSMKTKQVYKRLSQICPICKGKIYYTVRLLKNGYQYWRCSHKGCADPHLVEAGGTAHSKRVKQGLKRAHAKRTSFAIGHATIYKAAP